MINSRFRYFVALFLLLVFVSIVSGQGRQTCGQTCFRQPCSVSQNDCKKPCKCQQIFSPNADDGQCATVTCRTEFCSCSTFIISDVPNETCCPGLRCLDSKTLKPAKGQGICRK